MYLKLEYLYEQYTRNEGFSEMFNLFFIIQMND